jgi:hypothetical protein
MIQKDLFSASSFNTPPKKELRTSLKKLLTAFALIFILISSLACKKSPNEPDSQDFFSFTFEDVSCTEAWFNIKIFNLEKPVIASVYVNDALNSTFNIISSDDTTFYVENLLPKKNYEVYVELISADKKFYRSNRLSFTTMDTTSHNFTFQSWEFGEGASSALYDVAIIDENNIWAVGEIYLKDSLGNYDPHAYNAVHWDGKEWKLLRIKAFSSCNPVDYPPIHSIWAFDSNNIIFMTGGGIIRYNGSKYQIDCSIRPLLNDRLNKLWGSSSEDLYAVGNSGMIAHWDGKRWTKIESGTNLHIYDIWGDYDKKTNEWEILAVASNYGNNNEKEILKIKKDKVEKISTRCNFNMEPLLTVWFIPNKIYYVAGAGIYQKFSLQDFYWKSNLYNITQFATTSISGTNLNDVVGVGSFGDFIHFNGYTWKNNYKNTSLNNGAYSKVVLKDNIVVAVGSNNTNTISKAIILVGRR